MIPSSADSDPSSDVPDATVEMERPKDLAAPARPAKQGPPLDATIEIERPPIPARPADAKRKPTRIAFDDNGPAHRTPFPSARPSSHETPPPASTLSSAERPRAEDPSKSPLPGARLDATVELERPSGVSRPPSSVIYTRTRLPAARLDATLEIERPKSITRPPPSESIAPYQPPAAPLNATVEMARPNISTEPNTELGRSTAMTPPALANLEATVEIARPSDAENLQQPHPSKELIETEAIDLSAAQAQRQLSARKSDVVKRNTPPPGSAGAVQPKKLGEILVQMGKLSPEQVNEAVQLAHEQGERVGSFLLRWDLVQPETLCRALSIQTGLPMTMLESDAMPEHLSKLFPLPLMMHHHFVPFDESGAVLCLAAGSPLDPAMVREQEQVLRKVIEVFIAREDQVARQLDWLRMKLKTRSRRSPRYTLRLTVSFQFCNRLGARQDKSIHAATTVNISEGGYLLECAPISEDPSDMLLKGMYVNVCIKSMTGDIWTICDVREIRLIDDGREPKWLVGVEILDINPENKKRLKALCKRPAKPAQ